MESNGPGDSGGPPLPAGPSGSPFVKVEFIDQSGQGNPAAFTLIDADTAGSESRSGDSMQTLEGLLPNSEPPMRVQISRDEFGSRHFRSTGNSERFGRQDSSHHRHRDSLPPSRSGAHAREPSGSQRRAHGGGGVGPIRHQTRTRGQGPTTSANQSNQRQLNQPTAISQGPAQHNSSPVGASEAQTYDSRFSAQPSFLRSWDSASTYGRTNASAYPSQSQGPTDGSAMAHHGIPAPQAPVQHRVPHIESASHARPQHVPAPVPGPAPNLPIGHAARFFPQPSRAIGPSVPIVPSQGLPTAAAAPEPVLLPTYMPPSYPPPGHTYHGPGASGHATSNPSASAAASHPGSREFECTICRFRCDTREACQRHVLVEHVIPAFLNTCSRIPQNVRELPRPPTQ